MRTYGACTARTAIRVNVLAVVLHVGDDLLVGELLVALEGDMQVQLRGHHVALEVTVRGASCHVLITSAI